MSAGNPSSGGVVVPVHADFGPFDAQVAAKRAQGITINAQVTAQGGGGGAAAAIAQAQSAAVTPGQSGFTPPAPGIPSLANIGGTPSFAGGMSSQALSALATAATSLTTAAQRLEKAADQSLAAAKTLTSNAAQTGAAARAGQAVGAGSGDGGSGGGAGGISGAPPRSLRSLFNRIGTSTGGLVGFGTALALESTREIVTQNIQGANELRLANLQGASQGELAQIGLSQVERVRNGGVLGLNPIISAAGEFLADKTGINPGGLFTNLREQEAGYTGAIRAARDKDFYSYEGKLERSANDAIRGFRTLDPLDRRIDSIKARGRERVLEINARYNEDIERNKSDNGKVLALENARKTALTHDEEVTNREIIATGRDYLNDFSLRQFSLRSQEQSIAISAGLTYETQGASRGTRSALSQVQSIIDSTEASRQQLILGGFPGLVGDNARLGRTRLLSVRNELTASSEGVEINPFRQALTGVGTLDNQAVQRAIGIGLGKVGNISTDPTGFGAGPLNAPAPPDLKPIAKNTQDTAASAAALVTLVADFLSKIQVA